MLSRLNSRCEDVVFPGNELRIVRPELLDELPQDSPAAQASRRDLRIINRLLGSASWLRRVLKKHYRTGEHVLEIGAGTGELGQSLSAITPYLAGLDLARRPPDWPRQAPWFETNVLQFDRWADYPIVIGNLFFHHFDHVQLEHIGRQLGRHARVIIANETLRGQRVASFFPYLCSLIRAHQVTRYDGHVSIAAGFRHDELPHLLHLDPAIWSWRAQESWLGTYRLVAERRA